MAGLITVRPSSGVYTLTNLPAELGFVVSPLAAAPVGSGLHLTDDSDATYVPLEGALVGADTQAATVAAVDFAPVSGASVTPDDFIGVTARFEVIPSGTFGYFFWQLLPLGGGEAPTTLQRVAFHDLTFNYGTTPTTPTTFAPDMDAPGTFGGGWTYPVNEDMTAAIASEGFTLAFVVQEWDDTTVLERIRLYEAAVTLVGAESTGLAPLRQFPRDDELGTASARRIWPTSSQQATNRRLGYY